MFNIQNKQVNPRTIPFSPQTYAKIFSGFYPSVKIQAVGSTTLQCMFIKVRVSQKSTNITVSMRQRKCEYSLTGNPAHIMEMLRDLYKRSHHIYITTHIHWRPQSICDTKEKADMKIYPLVFISTHHCADMGNKFGSLSLLCPTPTSQRRHHETANRI